MKTTGADASARTRPPVQYSILDAWLLGALALAGMTLLLPDMRGAAGLSEADWHRSSEAVLVLLGLSVAGATLAGALLGVRLAVRLRLRLACVRLTALMLACAAWPVVLLAVPPLAHTCFHWKDWRGEWELVKRQRYDEMSLVDRAFANAEKTFQPRLKNGCALRTVSIGSTEVYVISNPKSPLANVVNPAYWGCRTFPCTCWSHAE